MLGEHIPPSLIQSSWLSGQVVSGQQQHPWELCCLTLKILLNYTAQLIPHSASHRGTVTLAYLIQKERTTFK